MRKPGLPLRVQARFREVTLLVFLASIGWAVIGLAKILSGGAGALAVGWGIAAAGFGIVFTVRAMISFVYNDGDYVESWSVLSAFMYTVFALAAFNWFGLVAAVSVTAAWMVGRSGHAEEERIRRATVRQRREALSGRQRADSGRGPAADLLDESALDLSERAQRRLTEDSFDQHPGTRRGSIERARMIDGNPWHLPPK